MVSIECLNEDRNPQDFDDLVDVQMRAIASYPRMWRMRMAGHLSAILRATKGDLKIMVNPPYVDVKITAGEKVLWTRWQTTTPLIQAHMSGVTSTLSHHDFRERVLRMLL